MARHRRAPFPNLSTHPPSLPLTHNPQQTTKQVLFPVLLGVGLRARVPPLRQALESPKAKLPFKCVWSFGRGGDVGGGEGEGGGGRHSC